MNLVIPQKDTKPKKTYTATIEGDKYTIKGSVLIFRDATRCYNKIFSTSQKEYENDIEALEDVTSLIDEVIKLYEILLGKEQAEKLINKIDKKYDSEQGQYMLMQYAGLIYNISIGKLEKQEDIDNFFRKQQDTETEKEAE